MTLSYIPSDTNDEGILKATASGSLPNGKPVIVNADGTVSVAALSSISDATTLGASIAGNLPQVLQVYHAAADRIVTIIADENESNYARAYAGTISTSSISNGSVATASGGLANPTAAVYDPSSQKIVVLVNSGSVLHITSLTVSGTTVSWLGSSVEVDGQGGSGQFGSLSYDTVNETCVIAFQNRYSRFAVRTYQSSSATLGTYQLPNGSNNGATSARSIVYDDNIGRHIAVWDTAATTIKYSIISVSAATGDNITFTSPGTFSLTNISGAGTISVGYDQNSNFVIVGYAGSSTYATVRGFQFSTSAITATTNALVYASYEIERAAQTEYSPVAEKLFQTWNLDGGDEDAFGTSFSNFSNGSTISMTTAFNVGTDGSEERSSSNNSGMAYVSSIERMVLGVSNFSAGGSNNPAKSYIITQAYNSTNLTAENYIGMSSGVVTFVNQAVGSPQVFEAANSRSISSSFDSSNNKVVVAYKDEGNSSYGTAIVGTVSGNSISFGSAVVFESAETDYISVSFDSSNNKVVIAYRDRGNSNYGTAIVGTVSSTSISFGTPVVFESADSTYISSTFDSNSNKVVIAYADGGNSSYGTAIVGTVSGTNISFGSATAFNSGATTFSSTSFDSSNNKVVIAYSDGGNSSYGTAIVGTVSGTSISFGSEVVFEAAEAQQIGSTFDSSSNKVVVAYQDNGNSGYGNAVVGTVSGTGISFGTAVIFETARSNNSSVTFDTSSNKVVIAYQDVGNSNYGTFISGTVSGTSISFGTAVVFEAANSDTFGATFDSNSNKVVIAYRDTANSNYGTGIVVQTASTNRGQVPSGTQATTNIIGSVSSNQNALTAGQSYFVQTDGTIGTTAADPSVFAGTAISATKLIVKT